MMAERVDARSTEEWLSVNQAEEGPEQKWSTGREERRRGVNTSPAVNGGRSRKRGLCEVSAGRLKLATGG